MNRLPDYRLLQRDYLLRIARAMTARLDLREVLALVIRYAVEITNGRAGLIAMRQADGRFEVMAGYGLEEEYLDSLHPLLDRVSHLLPPDGARGWNSAQLERRLRRLAAHLPASFAQVLALPLAMHDELIGVLFVFRSAGAAVFSPLDSQLLTAFADQAAIAVQNANLYAEMAVQARELRHLYDFSVSILRASDRKGALELAAQHAASAGPSEWLAILCWDETSDRFIERVHHGRAPDPFSAGALTELDGPSLDLLRRDSPLVIPNLREDEAASPLLRRAGFRSVIGLPIQGATRLLGVLWAASTRPNSFGSSDVRLLMTFTQYLGLALDRLNYLERLAARERQLAAIVEHSPAGMLLLDASGRVLMQNPVSQTLTGWTEDPLTGVQLGELLRMEDEAGQRVALKLPTGAAAVTAQGYLRRRDGTRGAYVQVTITPLLTAAGVVEGYVANVVDLTAYKENESAKNAFLAGLSHELKTPLALIRGFAETLRYPQVHQDEKLYHESLDVILTETDHLTQMVNQLLQAARLQARALTLDLDQVALGPLLERLVDEFRQTFPTHLWQVEVAENLPTITADPVRLREVFQNLLSNAVKYSDPDSLTRVEAATTRDGVRVSVSDEGVGIAPEDQQRLFQRFFRASDRADGTGLGLYMSKAIIEAHGGAIRVESEPGKGSTFTVELPRGRRGKFGELGVEDSSLGGTRGRRSP